MTSSDELRTMEFQSQKKSPPLFGALLNLDKSTPARGALSAFFKALQTSTLKT